MGNLKHEILAIVLYSFICITCSSTILAQQFKIIFTPDSAYYDYHTIMAAPSSFVPYDVEPKVLKRASPIYPQEARDRKIEGNVFLKCWVTTNGSVRSAWIMKSDDNIFNKSAMECCLQWSFTPAIKDGRNIDVIVHVPLRFRLSLIDKDGFALQILPPKNLKPKSPPVIVKHDTLTYPASAVLPSAASIALDEKLQDWKIAKLSEDSLNPKYNSFFKCDLNKDKKPDYVLVVVTGIKSTLTEHYVAIVSFGDKYNAFILRSYNISKFWIDDHRLWIYPKGTHIALFGNLDSSVPYKQVPNEAGISFDVDCIIIIPNIGSNCVSYVYHKNRFYDFSSCD